MELSDYVRVVRKFSISITAVTLVGLAIGALMSLVATPTYTASTSLFLTVQNGNSASDLAQGSTYTERQVKSFAEVAQAPIVMQPVIDQLGLDATPAKLAARTTVSIPTNTSVLEIAVVDTDPARATATAAALAERLVATVAEVAPKDAEGQASVEATIIRPATPPTGWTTPNVSRDLALGLLVGLMLGVGQALLRTVLDTRVHTADDLARVTDAPLVATIAFDEEGTEHALPVVSAPSSVRAEEYRRLRTNLQFLAVGPQGRSLAISSSLPSEGKTTTTINAALALAAAGKRVLLVDADLRRPRVHKALSLERNVGLTTVLIGNATVDDVIQAFPQGNIDVITSGVIPPNPSELLGSEAMRVFLANVNSRYDYVLLDTAPLIAVSDTAVLSSLVGGLVLVASSGGVHASQLAGALADVEAAKGTVVGVVLNKLRAETAGRYGSYYRYESYGETPDLPPFAPLADTEAIEPPRRAATPV